jgi:hypothetical protein
MLLFSRAASHSFYFILKRANAAVFLQRLSSAALSGVTFVLSTPDVVGDCDDDDARLTLWPAGVRETEVEGDNSTENYTLLELVRFDGVTSLELEGALGAEAVAGCRGKPATFSAKE